MDKKFLKFLRDKKDVTKVALVIALGLILIFLGGRKDTPVSEDADGIEERIAAACSEVEGVGECEVFLYFAPGDSREEQVVSVIVVCEGADSAEVRLCLTSMLSSFFGIGTNRIRIEKMKN